MCARGLGACLAMDYRLWAARLDVPLAAVEIDLAIEFDARGALLDDHRDPPRLAPADLRRDHPQFGPRAPIVAHVVDVANAHCPCAGHPVAGDRTRARA